jgi:hypothetical protein
MHACRNALAAAALFSLAPAAAQSPVAQSVVAQSPGVESPGAVQSHASEPAAPPAPSSPMRVTTDTTEYCDTLASRVAQAEHATPHTPPQVEELAEEGHHMCATGLIRGGLVRLRRALLLLQTEK